MEEILQELIKTTLERGPQNKQFYSNLSITKPIHDQAEAQSKLVDAIEFLRLSFESNGVFQSKLYTNRNCAIECDNVYDNFRSSHAKEIVTSVLALDLLFNSSEDQLVSPHFQQIVTLPNEIQDALQDFIVPSWGLSTFNLFKQLSPSSSPGVNLYENGHPDDFIDSGNDSPTSMHSHSELTFTTDHFPDDINTTSVTLSVLLQQGILQPKPAESVVRWIISNVFVFKDDEGSDNSLCENLDEKKENITLITFPTFITRQGTTDPVAVANFLSLMYSLDISHEVVLKNSEELLISTLKNTLAVLEDSPRRGSSSTKTTQQNSLGNTSRGISSEVEEDGSNERKKTYNSINDQVQPFILHHSPDSLLYFLSRSLAITSSCRPAHNQIKMLLLELLDVRLGTTMDPCDLAMRILAAVYLGVFNNPNNGGKNNRHNCKSSNSNVHLGLLNSLLQKEFEMLVSMQNVDGSWPPDAIVKIGLSNSGSDEGIRENNTCGGNNVEENVGYLGGTQLATLFAVKAISAFLSGKKGELWFGEVEDETESEDDDLEVHHLY